MYDYNTCESRCVCVHESSYMCVIIIHANLVTYMCVNLVVCVYANLVERSETRVNDLMKTHPHHTNYDITEDGKVFSRRKNRFLTPTKDGNGYERVSIYVKEKGKSVTMYVHKLVAETYIENPFNHKFIAHKDDNRSNNKVGNLFWRKTSRSPTEHELYLERNKVLEYKKFLEERGYVVLDQKQAKNIMDRIRGS